MTPEARAALQALAAALAPGSGVTVPREWVLDLLSGCQTVPADAVGTAPADLTVVDLAARFGRRTSTVRGWLDRGLFPGAYKFMGGREWRVPAASLATFEAQQRSGGGQGGAGPAAAKRGDPADLSAWRKAS